MNKLKLILGYIREDLEYSFSIARHIHALKLAGELLVRDLQRLFKKEGEK